MIGRYDVRPSYHDWQRILNATTPRHYVRRREPIPVHARIVWETDREEWVETVAIAWDRTDVVVELDDRRSATIAVWIPASDVRRR